MDYSAESFAQWEDCVINLICFREEVYSDLMWRTSDTSEKGRHLHAVNKVLS